jgi:nucleotide-binding universal stress UspA family protein
MSINKRISFRRILCPVDLTPESNQALRYGVALAKAYSARLFVIHFVEGYAVAGRPNTDQISRRLESAVSGQIGFPYSDTLDCERMIVTGDPDVEIPRVAAERHVDLIVMSSRRRPYAAALLGSTTESVCRMAPCPVLVMHPNEREWVGLTTNEVGLRRVLVAYDSSSDSELALSYGLSLVQEYQAELHLLHVLPSRAKPEAPEIAYLPASAMGDFLEAASLLASAVPAEARAWCEVKHAVREGHPYREVLAYAEEQNIDLICLGASGTGFGMRALFGSNADRVLRQAPCPVLIARPLRPMIAAQASVMNYKGDQR